MNTEGRGNAGLMDAEENQKQVFPRRPQPLEIAERDFHISTAPATRGKVENRASSEGWRAQWETVPSG